MLSLSFEPMALERCFLVADVLAEEFQTPFLEYALIGLSDSRRPLHVVRTPLLPGQRCSSASVEQRGSAVLQLRGEIQKLSVREGRSLLPVAFVHRHPSRSCSPSATDREFLRGVFIDQVSTVLVLPGVPSGVPTRCPRGCPEPRLATSSHDDAVDEHGVAFSLIVSRQRNYELHAAAKQRCAVCATSWVCDVPAKLVSDPDGRLSSRELADLSESLKHEIEEKLDPHDLEETHDEPRA